jgi:hypothetical protein
MTLDDARGHEGETLIHRFPDNDPEQAELVRVGNHALHVRLGDSGEVVTMHPRHFEFSADYCPEHKPATAAGGDGPR